MPRKRQYPEICTEPNCGRASITKGLCGKHYVAHRRALVGYSSRKKDINGAGREARLARLLSQAETFLGTLNALSDRLCAQSGRTRSAEAQGLYETAEALRAAFRQELKREPITRGALGGVAEQPDWFGSANGRRVAPTGGPT